MRKLLAMGVLLLTACVSQISDISFNEEGERVVYSGLVGQTALVTLKRRAVVKTQSLMFGEFVTHIEGIEGDGQSSFWAFFVNGEKSKQGAGDYVAQEGDIFEWRLTRRSPTGGR
jgi:hypothetical protein